MTENSAPRTYNHEECLTFIEQMGLSAADGSPSFTVFNPATGSAITEVSATDWTAADDALRTATTAFAGWRDLPPRARGGILRSWAERVTENRIDLARLLSFEQGKPFAEALAEIDTSVRYLDWFAEEAKRIFGDVVPSGPDSRGLVFREPVGVCLAITPWNFPASMVARKVAPALAAGCTVLLKPSEYTPLIALAYGALAREAGVPQGVFTVITVSSAAVAEISDRLLRDPRIAKLSFTGSTRVGKILAAACAAGVKRLSLELGGNAPFIVMADADLDAAVDGAITAKFRNAGQACISANRFFVESSVHDDFVSRLADRVKALRIGSGDVPGVQQGPLINEAAVEKVETLVKDAVLRGGAVAVGGVRSDAGAQFFEPTVITGITPDMRLMTEETFGPVAPVFRFDNDDQAITLANDTEYGLACYVYGNDMRRLWKITRALQFGMIGCNTPSASSDASPFGGMKESGMGREGAHYGIEEYLETKYVAFGGLN